MGRYTKRFLTILTLSALSFSPLQGQANPVLNLLKAKNLNGALLLLKGGKKRPRGADAIEAAQLLTELPATTSKRKTALIEAMGLLLPKVSRDLSGARAKITVQAGLALGKLLCAKKLRPTSKDHHRAVTSLERARIAILSTTKKNHSTLKEIDLLLIPLCRNLNRNSQVAQLCREALALNLSPSEKTTIQWTLGNAFLGIGRVKEALPLLESYIKENPEDPTVIGPVAKVILTSNPPRAFDLLFNVIRSDPNHKVTEPWTNCLGLFYRTWKKLSKKKPPLLQHIRNNQVDLALPKMWGGVSWKSGFRIWRPDNTIQGKTYSGRHRVRALLPLSKGWRRINNPGGDLQRWGNCAFAFQRGSGGPILAFYWFGPDLTYWYGTTDRTRGFTGKGSRGQSKSGICSTVTNACYGKQARQRGLRFKKASSPKLSLGISSGVTQKQWSYRSNLYLENFFSIGQVTGEVVLKISKKDLKRLRPEIQWLYRNIKVK